MARNRGSNNGNKNSQSRGRQRNNAAPRKKSGILGKILCLLLGFVMGVVGTIGGIGGLVGGVLGALILYFAYNGACGSFDQMEIWLPVYLVIGLVGAVATAFGDLVESAIKRKIGIKDMGKIMPGHGGALDRIDSVLFASIIVYTAYLLIVLCV